MKIGINGIGGRMGTAILNVALERGHVLAGAFDVPASPAFSRPVGELPGCRGIDLAVSELSESGIRGADCVIDFSSPAGTGALLKAAVPAGVPVVIGTTGLDDEQMKSIRSATEKIPVLFSPNMSVGVNLLFKLVEIAAGAVPGGFDVEIMESHHRFKKDAPSGTAMKLLDIVKENRKGLEKGREITGREGMTGERSDDEIGVLALRGGDIVGEHTVYFVGMGERIELTHRAGDRAILARGAVTGAEFLPEKSPGLYSMFDVLGL